MTGRDRDAGRASRRGFLAATAGLAAGGASLAVSPAPAAGAEQPDHADAATFFEPFWGVHQSGIVTPAQAHVYLVAFDLTTAKRADVETLLRQWTEAAALLCAGQPAAMSGDPSAADPPDTLGLSPSRLTLTFGFGAGLFIKDGADRYGLRAQRPEAFVDLPNFPGEQLAPARTGGDLLVQACADNPQVAFHAARQLGAARLWDRANPLGTGRIRVGLRREKHAAQSDGLQGRHRQSSRR
jgi:deferrochelatase/peroxidase EfeB